MKNVSKTYMVGEQLIHALKNINFVVNEGEFVAVMGPSGSGKSTFLQVASILADASSGEIWINGKEISKYSETQKAQLRNKEIGFIFQQFNLLPNLNALENVMIPMIFQGKSEKERQERAKFLLSCLGLEERIFHRPTELSGGEQQRVAIARALINEPALILADEPTGNLDSHTGAEIIHLLLRLNQERGLTLVIVTHDPTIAAQTQRVIRLRDGLIENG